MTVDLFAICYNEELLLPYFIEHYKNNFNANITIYDNGSTDKSVEIIKSYGCKVIPYNSNNEIRDDIYLSIKNECWKTSKADFVIVCDIDEFLEVKFPVQPYSLIRSKGYDVLGMPPSRLGVANTLYDKVLMFRPKRITQIGYSIGCHTCSPEGAIIPSLQTATLLHYKYISENYLFERRKLYAERLSDVNKKYSWGAEYMNTAKEEINKIWCDKLDKAKLI